VLGTHREAVGAAAAADGGAATGAAAGNSDVLSDALLKRYIHYARCKCFPRLNAAAARKLQQKYVEIRDKVGGSGWEWEWVQLATNKL
jgi:DNA replicative helicase MCM subunit Mcm2 (Cdc46/Mcm family)